jgi:hypothetical protein
MKALQPLAHLLAATANSGGLHLWAGRIDSISLGVNRHERSNSARLVPTSAHLAGPLKQIAYRIGASSCRLRG